MERIWWERVPNAFSYISTIVNSLLQEKSIVVQYNNALPWREYFLYKIQSAVGEQECTKGFKYIADISNPGEYLFNTFCKVEKRASYRATKSYAKFLAESDDITLHDQFLFVEVNSYDEIDQWEEYISEYTKERGRHKPKAVFMIMYHGTRLVSAKKGITCLKFDDCITEYDRIVFATLASATVNASSFVKDYLTELASSIIGNDIELCAECIHRYREFLNDPFRTIHEIVNTEIMSDNNNYAFSKNEAEVTNMIWRSQIRSIYPYLEEYRETFVNKHRADIKRVLPVESSIGEICSEPEDVELGTLVYLAGRKNLNLATAEYETLEKYRNARNALSHLKALTMDEITALHITN